jgi:hypothetical protein
LLAEKIYYSTLRRKLESRATMTLISTLAHHRHTSVIALKRRTATDHPACFITGGFFMRHLLTLSAAVLALSMASARADTELPAKPVGHAILPAETFI